MKFAIMAMTSRDGGSPSVFGVLNKDAPGRLPEPPKGYNWIDFRVIDEGNFKFTEDAKKDIAENGYYLMGAGVTVTEAFGEPPQQ